MLPRSDSLSRSDPVEKTAVVLLGVPNPAPEVQHSGGNLPGTEAFLLKKVSEEEDLVEVRISKCYSYYLDVKSKGVVRTCSLILSPLITERQKRNLLLHTRTMRSTY